MADAEWPSSYTSKLSDAFHSGNYLEVLCSDFAQDSFSHLRKSFGPHWLESKPSGLDTSEDSSYIFLGLAALYAFLQANVTGPPLSWSPKETLSLDKESPDDLHHNLTRSLSIDGISVYGHIPFVELFCLARLLLTANPKKCSVKWPRLRLNFWHQMLLSENAASLETSIYDDLKVVASELFSPTSQHALHTKEIFLLERAAVHIHHGYDSKARDDLEEARRLNGFEHMLTGRLGKRTKFQQSDLSQLVVLARSGDDNIRHKARNYSGDLVTEAKPENISLIDDTVLEKISFSSHDTMKLPGDATLPEALQALDPGNQPTLSAEDAINLLLLASSIINTNPEDGLTREETLPYATRVLEGESSNWQVYTQALLVRSRIEGYRSRTVERGALQLQALVDQIIADTHDTRSTGNGIGSGHSSEARPATFLPRPKESESAPVTERLRYIHQLASPTRWTLEAELAARWTSLGALRTALEIYERLQMHAEMALCWAALNREDKAIEIIRRQLFEATPTPESSVGAELRNLPADAPRLFCILGDLEKNPEHYKRAWIVSCNRYARAQRSLGKHYLAVGDLKNADAAYASSLRTNPHNHGAWFNLGCVKLELKDWPGSVDAFGRAAQLENDDAETWSNLAAALLHLSPGATGQQSPKVQGTAPASTADEKEVEVEPSINTQKHTREAFIAFKRAANLKRDNYRIWQNLLNVAATLSPPPYSDIIVAQQRIIDMRANTDGEACIDIEILEGLLSHVIVSAPENGVDGEAATTTHEARRPDRPRKSGLEKMFSDLIGSEVFQHLITSRRMWKLMARWHIFQNRPAKALDAYEKARRAALSQPGWEAGVLVVSSTASEQKPPETAWQDVVDATLELVDAYESLGEREDNEGLKAGSGELVSKNWRSKAKMAINAVVGRREKAGLPGTEGLRERLEDLKNA